MTTQLPEILTYDWVWRGPGTGELVETAKQPTFFTRDDGTLCVSGEDGLGFVDYYGEFRGGYPYIHPVLVEWANERGSYWEWENPGCIVLCD